MISHSTLTIPDIILDEMMDLCFGAITKGLIPGEGTEKDRTDVAMGVSGQEAQIDTSTEVDRLREGLYSPQLHSLFCSNLLSTELSPRILSAFWINFIHNRLPDDSSRPFLSPEQLKEFIEYIRIYSEETGITVSPSTIGPKSQKRNNYLKPVGAHYLLWLETVGTPNEDE